MGNCQHKVLTASRVVPDAVAGAEEVGRLAIDDRDPVEVPGELGEDLGDGRAVLARARVVESRQHAVHRFEAVREGAGAEIGG